MIYRFGSKTPRIHDNTFIAPDAAVIGDVTLEEGVSVWFNAVIRGDIESIHIGADTSVQESVTIHADPGFPVRTGRGLTIGHHAMVHGCHIDEFCLIGINAVVLNGARIGPYCMIGANALITEGTEIPGGSLVLGSPGKVVRPLTDAERRRLETGAAGYRAKGERFRQDLEPIG